MGRIVELDVPDRLARYAPVWATQLGIGLICALIAIGLREALDSSVPAAGPFALGLPLMLVATLFARLPAGLVTGTLSILHAWYYLLPPRGSFRLETSGDATRLAVAIGLYAAVLAIAELFRAAVRRTAAERDRQIAERDLLLEEFDHRVKNNFAMVVSMLELQRRRAADPATAEALGAAAARVESIARAHRHLYRGSAPGTIDMAAYLAELCAALAEALFLQGGTIRIACAADSLELPRDRAVSLGLVVNELVTNAAKHGFPDREGGSIQVSFRAADGGWRLTVADDGAGMPDGAPREGGLGQRLVEAFAKQAGGTVATESGPGGTRVTVTLAG